MQSLSMKTVSTPWGEKTIRVCVTDIRAIDEELDVMTLSAFRGNYENTPGTLFHALWEMGMSVAELADRPELDLRRYCGVWLSREVEPWRLPIRRIGCVEMSPYTSDRSGWRDREEDMLTSIRAYFRMLDIAALRQTDIRKVGLPILGGGNQRIPLDIVMIPILNECVRFLKQNECVREICIITRNQQQAFQAAMTMEKSYSIFRDNAAEQESEPGMSRNLVFISYSSRDKNIADNLCSKLEAEGIRVWYAPRDIVSNDYASAIVDAIERCTHFVVIISGNSLASNHVLNEINLAFEEISRGVRFLVLRIDEENLGPAFRYYLSRQHWMDARVPPLEKRLEEFVQKIRDDKYQGMGMERLTEE